MSVWEEPGDGPAMGPKVTVDVGQRVTIVVAQGVVDHADEVHERATARPRLIRPRRIGVRYHRYDDDQPWTTEVTLTGPIVRTTGVEGQRTGSTTFIPGGDRPPWWAARFALDHHPDPDMRGERETGECVCVLSCADDPPTACSQSGRWHTHPDDGSGTFGPCPVHPDAPGDT